MLIEAMPAKNTRRLHLFDKETLPVLYKTYPTTKLNNAHRTLIVGDDNPFPGGLAKGVGKLLPQMPCT
ncbi:MAG: hypothetical protein ACHP6H_07450 [Legionellales bacterium]